MSDYDDGGQLDPGYTGNDQPDVFGGHDVDFGHYEAGQEHGALDRLHADHGSETDFGQQFGVFEHNHAQAETSVLEHGQHVEYSAGYDEGEQPSFTGGNIDDLHDRLSRLGGEGSGGEAHLGVASN
ncbi:hypothetical protein ABT297_23700 [Dactylosporangium sp. NPDC000555]|uniref:hypothetical protein n=1 Tax=Dactylosporangium sp. NPDC000555 TaxID=3154260 RepID=UPI0033182EC3